MPTKRPPVLCYGPVTYPNGSIEFLRDPLLITAVLTPLEYSASMICAGPFSSKQAIPAGRVTQQSGNPHIQVAQGTAGLQSGAPSVTSTTTRAPVVGCDSAYEPTHRRPRRHQRDTRLAMPA
jgi:hypothetical protein